LGVSKDLRTLNHLNNHHVIGWTEKVASLCALAQRVGESNFIPSELQSEMKLNCLPMAAVYEHIEGNNHTLNLESTSVLDTELHPFRRKVKEALHIKASRPCLNRDSRIELPSVYDLILN
jgi:hypothetical protein